jgi:hypothetical protein
MGEFVANSVRGDIGQIPTERGSNFLRLDSVNKVNLVEFTSNHCKFKAIPNQRTSTGP